ncbi:hypothetical protein sos41_38850 [Alphaproteobacteria bacterium SO-S41]|nr:hypothetical protein sos41_38850 [Alphaproteobacteria bacterium SO-S41]
MTPQMAPYLVAPLIVLIMIFRLRRVNATRALRLEWLWVMPVIMIAMAGFLLAQLPPHGSEWAWLGLAAIIGGAVGWYRGKMMRITLDPETHALSQQVSPAAMIFIVVLIAVRYGARALMNEQADAWHISPLFITDIFLVFVVGMLAMTRVEMALRARRMLAEARAR